MIVPLTASHQFPFLFIGNSMLSLFLIQMYGLLQICTPRRKSNKKREFLPTHFFLKVISIKKAMMRAIMPLITRMIRQRFQS